MKQQAQVLLDADVEVLDEAGTRAEAVAWKDGILIAVGSREQVLREAGPDATIFHAAGSAVLPGFIDAHHHPCLFALHGGLVRLEPPAVTDIASLLRALKDTAATLPPDRWLVATGWDEALLEERRPPTRRELDEAIPDRPMMALHYSCHRAVANSKALELAGISRSTKDPSGGAILRGAGGEPTGVLVERGMSRVESMARASLVAHDAERFFDRLAHHHRALAAAGITRVVDATVPGDLATLYREALRRGLLVVPTVMLPVSTAGWLEAPWEVLDAPFQDDAEERLSVGPVKLVFDGAPACAMCLGWWQSAGSMLSTWAKSITRGSLDPIRTALSTSPRIGRKIRTGINIYSREEANDIIRACAERGIAVATHAVGNDAVDVALSAFETAGAALRPPRIEHAMFLERAAVKRIRDAGAAVVAQPAMLSLPTITNAPHIPGIRNTPLRWLLDAGVTVAGSSDFPVAPFDPLEGIRAAVHRRTGRGDVLEPDQRVELGEALAMYTRTAARVSGCLDRAGTLEPGKRADLVALDGPLRSADDLASVRVRATVIGGEVVFGELGRSGDGR